MPTARLVDSHLHLETGKRLRRLADASPESGASELEGLAAAARTMAFVFGQCLREASAGGAGAADVRFNPLSWVRRGVPVATQVEVIRRIATAVEIQLGFAARIFATVKQDGREADWEETLGFALTGQLSGVQGIDISRSYDVGEAGASPPASDLARLKGICRQAHDHGLSVAVHCGWFDDREALMIALDSLGATRLGHGVPVDKDRGLLRRLAGGNVLIEICPSAYIRLSGKVLKEHPLPTWMEEGVRFGVGTDHPLAFETDLRREQDLLGEAFPSVRSARGPQPPP